MTTSSRGRLLQTNADQVLASACSYSLVMLVARASSPHDFGVFLITFGTVTVTTAVGRSAFGAILGMDLARADAASARDLETRSTAAVLGLGVAVGLLLAVLGLVVGGAIEPAILVVASVLPLVLLQDLARFGLVAKARPGRALLADALWLSPSLVLIVVDLLRGGATAPGWAALVWASGLVASLLLLESQGALHRPAFTGLVPWLTYDRRRVHLGADAAMAGLAPVGNGILAAAVSGASATATVRGAAAVFAPLATLALAMSLGAVPEAKRRRPETALRFLLGLTAALVALSAVWGLLLLVMPDSWGEAILGRTWELAKPILPLLALEYLGLGMWTGATAMLRYSDATRTALRMRLVYAPASLVLPVVALGFLGGVTAFAATLAVLGLLVGVIGLVLGVRAVRAKVD